MEGKKVGAALIRKVADLMKEVGAIPKNGKNAFHGYSYRRHEDIMNKLQPALAANGLVIIPISKKTILAEPGYILLEATYDITDGEQTIRFVGIGEGADKSRDGKPGDKAAYKAQTGAIKYALNDLLQLAGEDPESDQITHGKNQTPENQNQKTQTTPTQQKPASKQTPTETPKAKTTEHTITNEQRDELIEIMNKMGYDLRLIELGIQKATIEGFQVAKTALSARLKSFDKTAAK